MRNTEFYKLMNGFRRELGLALCECEEDGNISWLSYRSCRYRQHKLDDVTSHLLLTFTSKHLLPPGIEQFYEGDSGTAPAFNRGRSKLIREERIQLVMKPKEEGQLTAAFGLVSTMWTVYAVPIVPSEDINFASLLSPAGISQIETRGGCQSCLPAVNSIVTTTLTRIPTYDTPCTPTQKDNLRRLIKDLVHNSTGTQGARLGVVLRGTPIFDFPNILNCKTRDNGRFNAFDLKVDRGGNGRCQPSAPCAGFVFLDSEHGGLADVYNGIVIFNGSTAEEWDHQHRVVWGSE
ncbi:hypothetical protein BT96DRAFT_988483 [Gymnopus androsaceus JB14]|uniref:Uncharacterized protein n=1 Tax=Gymnopus androsaceus JB14 TaxID=1447944 RepID=A0A6A4I6B9_9AGAR|nr:hypothetical protein BT96DRAFT_988483 [Gymnopus androsaceus JB14]